MMSFLYIILMLTVNISHIKSQDPEYYKAFFLICGFIYMYNLIE
jgi:hypothetical protein